LAHNLFLKTHIAEIFALQNLRMEKSNAIVITGGYLDSNNAKTAHGLIRGTDRFNIVAFIDQNSAGKDAGEVLDGKNRSIPVYATIGDFLQSGKKATYCVIGVATKGGDPGFFKGYAEAGPGT
jgi:uncharacterized NAD-dependent epimerase/dehydratase family protein